MNVSLSIGRQVSEVLDKMDAGDPEKALQEAMIAVAATSRRTHPRKKGQRDDGTVFKRFVKDNIGVVTAVGLNVAQLGGLAMGGPGNSRTLETILYDIRNAVLHESKLPDNLKLTDNEIGGGDPYYLLPSRIIYGLLAAVVVAPVNRLESIPPKYTFTVGGKTARINDFWGKKVEFLDWFESARKGHSQSSEAGV